MSVTHWILGPWWFHRCLIIYCVNNMNAHGRRNDMILTHIKKTFDVWTSFVWYRVSRNYEGFRVLSMWRMFSKSIHYLKTLFNFINKRYSAQISIEKLHKIPFTIRIKLFRHIWKPANILCWKCISLILNNMILCSE